MMRRRSRREWCILTALDVAAALVLHHYIRAHGHVQQGWFLALATAIWDGIQVLWKVVEKIPGWGLKMFQVLGDGIAAAADGVFKAFTTMGAWFKDVYNGAAWLWSKVLKPFGGWIYDRIVDLHNLLKKVLGPVVNVLKATVRAVRKIYLGVLAPIFKVIDVTRKILDVLALLGVKSAAAVEQELLAFENRIRDVITPIVSQLNQVATWLNNIIDLDGIFQRVTLIKSMLTYKHDIINAGIRTMTRPMTPAEQATYDAPLEVMTPQEHAADLLHALDTGDGKQAALARELATDILNAWRAA